MTIPPLSLEETERRAAALTAGHQAAEAVAELLRYAREGEHLNEPFGPDTSPVEMLLEAAKVAIDLEAEWVEAKKAEIDQDWIERRDHVRVAIADFLEFWA